MFVILSTQVNQEYFTNALLNIVQPESDVTMSNYIFSQP